MQNFIRNKNDDVTCNAAQAFEQWQLHDPHHAMVGFAPRKLHADGGYWNAEAHRRGRFNTLFVTKGGFLHRRFCADLKTKIINMLAFLTRNPHLQHYPVPPPRCGPGNGFLVFKHALPTAARPHRRRLVRRTFSCFPAVALARSLADNLFMDPALAPAFLTWA